MDLSLIHYSDKELNWPGGKVPEVCKGEFSEPEYQKCHSLLSGFEERKLCIGYTIIFLEKLWH